jgi:N-acyl-D-amino-acid deacylase
MEQAIARIEAARAAGLPITADMYLYTASGTGLDSTLPGWVKEGGHKAMMERLADPALRARAAADLKATSQRDWSTVQPIGFKNPALRALAGKRLPEIAATRGKTVEETAVDLVFEDDSRVSTIFHSMDEDNLRKGLVRTWVSFGSDAAALAPEAPFTDNPPTTCASPTGAVSSAATSPILRSSTPPPLPTGRPTSSRMFMQSVCATCW